MSAHVSDRLSALRDRELTEEAAEAVRQHLRECPACAEELRTLEAVDRAFAALPAEAPPAYFDTFAARVRRRIEDSAAEAPPGATPAPPRRLPVWTWAAAAAVLIAVLLPRLPRDAPRPGGPEQAAPAAAPATAPAAVAREEAARVAAPTASLPTGAARRDEPRRQAPVAPTPAPPAPAAPAVAGPAPAPAPPVLARDLRPAPPPPAPTEDLALADAAPAPQSEGDDALLEARAAKKAATPERPGTREAAGGEAASGFAAEPPPARLRATGAAPSGDEPSGRREAGEERKARGPAGEVFAQLAARRPATLEERRALLAAWRAFVARHGETPEADAGRVEAVAAAVELALASGREDDRADARKEGAAYLARADAGQRGRVRELLARLP